MTSEAKEETHRTLADRGPSSPFAIGLLTALGIHLASRIVQLVVLSVGATSSGSDLTSRLSAWDGGWFIRIATEGYPDHIDLSAPEVNQTTGGIAFFPLYPTLMRIVSLLTGWSAGTSGVAITALAAIAASAGIYTLTVRLASIRVAIFAVALWSALPMSVVLSMVYSEALFTALAVWALVLVLRGDWLGAGALALLSGLTRATGLGVGLALVAAALALWVRRPAGAPRPGSKVYVGCIVGLLGTPLWWLGAGLITGRMDAWFAVQSAFWGSKFDLGLSFVLNSWDLLVFTSGTDPLIRVVNTVSVLTTLVALVLLVDLGLRTVRSPLQWVAPAVYCLVLLGLAVGSDGYLFSKMRFVVPMAPLLIPVAIALARARRVAAICVVVLLIIASSWWGTFMLTVWKSAI